MPGTTTFFARVSERVRATGGCLVVGLDPRVEEMSAAEQARLADDPVRPLYDHAARLFTATNDLVVAWKPNIAFYEQHGPQGLVALEKIIAMLRTAAPVLLDAKRGDIGPTADAYAASVFERLGADAVTVNPYFGEDALAPFFARPGKGVFVLARTSNPGAHELQELTVDGEPLWTHVVRAARRWADRRDETLGLVVGATAPEALARARVLAPQAWILAPGVGAQGAELEQVLAAARRPDGLGLLVPVSRAVSSAPDPRAAALALVDTMRAASSSTGGAGGVGGARPGTTTVSRVRYGVPIGHAALADALFDRGMVRFGEFTLKSGVRSPVYVDLRRLASHPDVLALAAKAYVDVLRGLRFDRVAALPYAALPIGTAVALDAGWPLVYPRREAKAHGTKADIEGEHAAGETVVVLDDVATRGDAKLEAFARLGEGGLVVDDVVVLIDREGGARAAIEASGRRFHAVFTLSELVARWESTGRLDAAKAQLVRDFLAQTAAP